MPCNPQRTIALENAANQGFTVRRALPCYVALRAALVRKYPYRFEVVTLCSLALSLAQTEIVDSHGGYSNIAKGGPSDREPSPGDCAPANRGTAAVSGIGSNSTSTQFDAVSSPPSYLLTLTASSHHRQVRISFHLTLYSFEKLIFFSATNRRVAEHSVGSLPAAPAMSQLHGYRDDGHH